MTGATGLLGLKLVPFLKERSHKVTSLGFISHIADINADLISYEQTKGALDHIRPEVIVNLTALTDVDRCESHPQEAYLLNVKPVENLCRWMRTAKVDCHLIQISSDQVYDGIGPHLENNVSIRNYYAMSKLAGEFAAGVASSTILRTNFVGRSERRGRTSLTDWLYLALKRGELINVFDNVMFSPLSMATLCDCIERSIVKRPQGVFNLGSHGGMSKADFAFAFANALGLSTANLMRNDFSVLDQRAARRPTDMRMLSNKFEVCFGYELPLLVDEIKVVANDYL